MAKTIKAQTSQQKNYFGNASNMQVQQLALSTSRFHIFHNLARYTVKSIYWKMHTQYHTQHIHD